MSIKKQSEDDFGKDLQNLDEKIITSIYVKCKKVVFYQLYNYTNKQIVLNDLEDLYDEAFFVFYEKIIRSKKFRNDMHHIKKICKFITSTAINKGKNLIKKKTLNIVDLSVLEYNEPFVKIQNDENLNAERIELLKNALVKIGEPCKSIIKLRSFYGYKLKEIAVILDIPYANVRKRIGSCHKKIKKLLNI